MRKAYRKVLLFGGTAEGRTAVEELLAKGIPCTVSVATQYGADILRPDPGLQVRVGRMDSGAMEQFMGREDFACVVDATHPHARIVSGEIRKACAGAGLPCLRLLRKTADPEPAIRGEFGKNEKSFFVRDAEEAGRLLSGKPGRVLVTIGSRELVCFARTLGDPGRITARVLPAPESLQICAEAGLSGRQVFAMQGPFDTEMNCALLRHAGAAWLLTKETGTAGGYPEKIEAAARCGAGLVVIRTPSDAEDAGEKTPGPVEYFEKTEEVVAAAARLADPDSKPGFAASASEGKTSSSASTSESKTSSSASASDGKTSSSTSASESKTGSPEFASASCVGGQRGKTDTGEAAEKAEDDPPAEKPAEDPVKKQAGDPAEKPVDNLSENPEEKPAENHAEDTAGKRLYLVGVGPGGQEALTAAAREAFAAAETVFGAESVLDNLRSGGVLPAEKTCIPLYESRGILQYLREHPAVRCAAAAYSGDTGFYSGASAMLETLKKEEKHGACRAQERQASAAEPPAGMPAGDDGKNRPSCHLEGSGKSGICGKNPPPLLLCGWEVHVLPGISCVSWFAARAGLPWQDWKILSSHGRFCNVVGQVRRNRSCFLLLAGAEDLRRTGKLLREAQQRKVLGPLRLLTGFALSRPQEEIREVQNPAELMEIRREGLYVLYIENEYFPMIPVLPGLPDEAFCRGRAPMTSEEIRVLSLSRLRLPARPVLWDVGAGTGSVSVEAALACPEGRIWAVEYKKEALSLLRENREEFCLQNLEIVEGKAPEALRDLPAPTHVFIGGSGGKIGDILREVFAKNPQARVVANCITPETLAALHEAMVRHRVEDAACIQVSVNRAEKLGTYHYLRASNPVFILSFSGHPVRGFPEEYRAAREADPGEET